MRVRACAQRHRSITESLAAERAAAASEAAGASAAIAELRGAAAAGAAAVDAAEVRLLDEAAALIDAVDAARALCESLRAPGKALSDLREDVLAMKQSLALVRAWLLPLTLHSPSCARDLPQSASHKLHNAASGVAQQSSAAVRQLRSDIVQCEVRVGAVFVSVWTVCGTAWTSDPRPTPSHGRLRRVCCVTRYAPSV
jgi:hypothetical protein